MGEKKRTARKAGQQPQPVNRRASSSPPLERKLIVSTALKIVDHGGLKALSMRRLGAELGVDPMAVYYHLPSKQALLDAIVEAVMASIDLTADDPSQPAELRILVAARAYRGVLLAHANALPILLARGPVTPVAMRPVELLTGILRDAGLPPAKALSGMNAIAAAVRGAAGMGPANEPAQAGHEHVEMEATWRALPASEFPYLAEAFAASRQSLEDFFEFGIRALARGLLAQAGQPSTPEK